MQLVDINVIGSQSLQTSLAVLLNVAWVDIPSSRDFGGNHYILSFDQPLTLLKPFADAFLRRSLRTSTATRDWVLFSRVQQIHARLEDGFVHKVET